MNGLLLRVNIATSDYSISNECDESVFQRESTRSNESVEERPNNVKILCAHRYDDSSFRRDNALIYTYTLCVIQIITKRKWFRKFCTTTTRRKNQRVIYVLAFLFFSIIYRYEYFCNFVMIRTYVTTTLKARSARKDKKSERYREGGKAKSRVKAGAALCLFVLLKVARANRGSISFENASTASGWISACMHILCCRSLCAFVIWFWSRTKKNSPGRIISSELCRERGEY